MFWHERDVCGYVTVWCRRQVDLSPLSDDCRKLLAEVRTWTQSAEAVLQRVSGAAPSTSTTTSPPVLSATATDADIDELYGLEAASGALTVHLPMKVEVSSLVRFCRWRERVRRVVGVRPAQDAGGNLDAGGVPSAAEVHKLISQASEFGYANHVDTQTMRDRVAACEDWVSKAGLDLSALAAASTASGADVGALVECIERWRGKLTGTREAGLALLVQVRSGMWVCVGAGVDAGAGAGLALVCVCW